MTFLTVRYNVSKQYFYICFQMSYRYQIILLVLNFIEGLAQVRINILFAVCPKSLYWKEHDFLDMQCSLRRSGTDSSDVNFTWLRCCCCCCCSVCNGVVVVVVNPSSKRWCYHESFIRLLIRKKCELVDTHLCKQSFIPIFFQGYRCYQTPWRVIITCFTSSTRKVYWITI